MTNSKQRRAWIIGGTTLTGIGVGLLFLKTSALIFIACLFIGIGAGLALAQFVPGDQDRE